MIEIPGATRRGGWGWICLAVLLSILALGLVFFIGGKSQKPGQIPSEVLAKIDQEKARARQDHADFMQTPAGQLWQKRPYWSPGMCRKIAAGELVAGMSKEQVREAVGKVVEVLKNKRETQPEEWVVECRNGERLILKFEGNALAVMERRKE